MDMFTLAGPGAGNLDMNLTKLVKISPAIEGSPAVTDPLLQLKIAFICSVYGIVIRFALQYHFIRFYRSNHGQKIVCSCGFSGDAGRFDGFWPAGAGPEAGRSAGRHPATSTS